MEYGFVKNYYDLCLFQACDYDSLWNNVKYVVQQILHEELETPRGKALQASGNMTEIW